MTHKPAIVSFKEIACKWYFYIVLGVFSALFHLSLVDGIFQDLDVKSLLLEAYVKGQQELLYVVPFVAKVLESSVRSVVSDFVLAQLLFDWQDKHFRN